MIKSKTKIYPAQNIDDLNKFVEIAQSTLKELGMETRSREVDKTLIEVMGIGKPGTLLKKNLVSIFFEANEIYIKFKSQMPNPEKFWELFEKNINSINESSEDVEKKAQIVTAIVKLISDFGFPVIEDDVWGVILDYEKKYKKLPGKDEINSIVSGYVKMMEEQGLKPKSNGIPTEKKLDSKEEKEIKTEEDLTVTPTEALKEMIREIETLTEKDKKTFISLFPDLTVDEQKKLVTRIKAIESDLDKIPYLTLEERAEIRKDILNLSTEKRRTKILKIIEKRKKDIQKYANKAMETDLRKILNNMSFLSDLEKDVYLSAMDQMNVDQKKKFLQRINYIENVFDRFKDEGINLNEVERRNYRDELVRMNDERRKKRTEEILENKKFEVAEKDLLEEIPSLKFEEHEKTTKELMWLTPQERKAKIMKIKEEFNDETKKKAKVFENSKVGSTCPECGWPIGAWTKKCPRCGKRLGFTI